MNERARFGEGMVTIVRQWTARKCKIRRRFRKKQHLPSQSVKKLVPWLVAVAFFMESLDTTILKYCGPRRFRGSARLTAGHEVRCNYTLSLAVFIPISGWMADRFGTRRVFAGAIGLFTLGSFLCGISSDIRLLVACRLLQGCGGAMMVPVGRLTLVRTFVKSELIRAMSFVAIPALIGPMLGPLSGGLIVGYLHWRFIFFLNLPIGFVGLLLVYYHLPDYRAERSTPLDVIGHPVWLGRSALFLCAGNLWRTHPEQRGSSRAPGGGAVAACRVRSACGSHGISASGDAPVRNSNLSRRGKR
jgi:hypothetical protein